MTKSPPHPPLTSLSSVPDEIVANCLARISNCHYRSLSSVSKSFHSLLSSPEIYRARSEIGATEPRLYFFCLRLDTSSRHRHRWFTLRTPDETLISNGGKSKRRNGGHIVNEGGCEKTSGLSLVPVQISSSSSYACARLDAAIVAVGSEMYQIGGRDDEDKRSRSRVVRVLDCRSNTRRLAPSMRVARKRAKSCFLDGKIYVIGGCRKREEPMDWAEVFDIKTQTWKEEPLPIPSGDVLLDPNHKVFVFGARLYVITERNKYAYDPKQGRWLPEMGFVGLEGILTTSRHWCVIETLVLNERCDKLWCYDLSTGMSLMVEGLTDLYVKRHCDYRTKQLLNYGGKLVIVWQEITDLLFWTNDGQERRLCFPEKRIWFAVIRSEKRLTSSGSAVWGEIERLNSIVPGSYKLWCFQHFFQEMLGNFLASPLATLGSAKCFRHSAIDLVACNKVSPLSLNSSYHGLIGGVRTTSRVLRNKCIVYCSTTQVETTKEDPKTWEECKEALSCFDFNVEEKDKILGKAFGHIHSPYWTEERVKETPKVETVNQILEFLRSLGLSDEDLQKVMKKFPEVLGCSLEDEMKPNIGILENQWGISGKQLRNLLLRNPKVLGYNVDCKGDCIAQCTRCWVRF